MIKPNYNQIEDLVYFINAVKNQTGLGYPFAINRLKNRTELICSSVVLFGGSTRDCYNYLKGYFETLIKYI